MKKLGFALVLTALFATPAQAACTAINCSNVTVEFLFIFADDPDIRIKLDADLTPLNCSPSGGQYLMLHGDSLNKKEIFSALLTASASGEPLRSIRIIENSNDCEVWYITY